jgi:hypothetical protein
MSPEQARGLPVDARTDVWTFGALLYEMLTGARPFPGPTMTDTLAQILEREPDWSRLPATTPAPVRALIQRCLKKESKQRLRDIADARFVLEDALATLSSAAGIGAPADTGGVAGATGATAPAPRRVIWRHPLPLGLAFASNGLVSEGRGTAPLWRRGAAAGRCGCPTADG